MILLLSFILLPFPEPRSNVQLIRSADGRGIWSDSFEDTLANRFAVQNSISQRVVRAISLQTDQRESALLQRPGTALPEAYQEYLKGRFFWNKRNAESNQRTAEHFKRSIELDPILPSLIQGCPRPTCF